MKTKILISAIVLFTSTNTFAQSTTSTPPSKVTSKHVAEAQSKNLPDSKNYKERVPTKTVMYRDTRLGSSSPQYNTYKKNDNGAGAVTTNPNKISAGSNPPILLPADTTRHN
jgi:hypothetical protein